MTRHVAKKAALMGRLNELGDRYDVEDYYSLCRRAASKAETIYDENADDDAKFEGDEE